VDIFPGESRIINKFVGTSFSRSTFISFYPNIVWDNIDTFFCFINYIINQTGRLHQSLFTVVDDSLAALTLQLFSTTDFGYSR
jgi:hypothetical protein